VAFALRQQIVWEGRRGNVAEALDDCLVLRRFGRHLQSKGLMIEQLVGISIEALGYDGIAAILRASDVPAVILDRVQKELERDFDLNRRVIDFEGEKALWLDRIQRNFTDDGHGGGHALSAGLLYAAGDWKDNLIGVFRFHYPGRRETLTMVDRYFQQAQGRFNAPPSPKDRAEPNDPGQASTLNAFLSLDAPAHERAGLQSWRLKTHETATITLLAVQRYFQANGSYPDSLDQLVERGFLKQPPRDPFGQGSLTYRKTDNGFLLYSWGADRKDDGGQLGTGNSGQTRMWADNGDWVFWPVNP
jgi:hypothetical protein